MLIPFFKFIQLLIKQLREIVMEQGGIVSTAWNSTCSSSRPECICVHDIHRNILWSGIVIFEKPSGVKFSFPEILSSQRCFGKNKWLLYQLKFFQFNLILAVFFWCQILLGLWIVVTTQSLSQVSNTDRFKKDINIFFSFAFLSAGGYKSDLYFLDFTFTFFLIILIFCLIKLSGSIPCLT